jgi:CheY-like chemotaxis protein
MESIDPPKVLIIDDEEQILRMLSMILSREGYITDTAKNGKDGIEKIKSDFYDLILTDIQMPGVSGTQVSKELKKNNGDKTPIIGMSGTPWLLDKTLFDAVFPKPASLKYMLEIIKQIVPVPVTKQRS